MDVDDVLEGAVGDVEEVPLVGGEAGTDDLVVELRKATNQLQTRPCPCSALHDLLLHLFVTGIVPPTLRGAVAGEAVFHRPVDERGQVGQRQEYRQEDHSRALGRNCGESFRKGWPFPIVEAV